MSTQLPIFDPGPGDRAAAVLTTARGALPLRAVALRAKIAGTTAGIEVEQAFENPYDEALEVRYVVRLPEAAAVTRCELRASGRVVAATLEEHPRWRTADADAIESDHRAALAECAQPGVLAIALGSLSPGERATVRFGMAHPLPREAGRHVFRFPLAAADRTDAAEILDASLFGTPYRMPGAVRPVLEARIVLIPGELGIDELESSLHAIEEAGEPHQRIVRLVAGQPMERDLVLRFRIGGESIRTQLWTQPDGDGGEGTFQLVVLPPAAPVRPRPRDVVLVLDRSASMSDWSLAVARRALARMIDALDDADRCAIYAFGSEVVAPAGLAHDRLHAATAVHRARAVEFLRGVWPSGGTDMAAALELATSLLAAPDPERDRWLVLVTDGRVGNPDALVALLAKPPQVRVLALGIAYEVDASLRRLVSATGGQLEAIDHGCDVEGTIDRFHLRLASPALRDVVVTGDTIVEDTVVPAGPRHAFPGVPLVVRGRYRRALHAVRVVASGSRGSFARDVPAARAALPALTTCWVRDQLVALEDRVAECVPRERDPLVTRIVCTSLGFNVPCRFTAFVGGDARGPIAAVDAQQPTSVAPVCVPDIAAASTVATTRWGGPPPAAGGRSCWDTGRDSSTSRSPDEVRRLPDEPPHEVYALARLLREVLTGAPLYDDDRTFENMQRILDGVLPVPLLPPPLARLEPVLRRALDPEPARRHPTPGAFANALEKAAAAASAEEVAAWVASVAHDDLAWQDELYGRIPGLAIPSRGYVAVARWATTRDATIYFAVRSGPGGPEAVALRRLHASQAEDPSYVEGFLSEASIAAEGIAEVDDAGTDSAGGVFRAQPFVRGVSLERLVSERSYRRLVPPEIAVSVIGAAARALQRALSLRTPARTALGMVGRDLGPSSLRIGLDGRPVWTSLGVAPSPHYAVPRRHAVPLTAVSELALESSRRSPMPLFVGRAVVVPRVVGGATERSPPRRHWGGWWP